MSAHGMSSPLGGDETPKRREFHELHPKDQQIKQTKKLCIEKNWLCRIGEALPEAIRPRMEIKKGAKARVGDPNIAEEVWWNWSVELLKALEELSSMTENELAYAQDLLVIEVEQRQANPRSSQRKILEVLLGDAQKVVDEQRKRLAVMYTSDVMQDEDAGMGMNMQYGRGGGYQSNYFGPPMGVTYQNAPHAIGGSPYHAGTYETLSTPFGGDAGTPRTLPQETHTPKIPQDKGNSNSLKSVELKAKAAKLRAEALRTEVEAAQAEADEWEAKARDLRET